MDKCKGKKLYDSEFEAEVGAAKTSSLFETEMIPYRHGRHWHISNKKKTNRGKHPKYRWCEFCKTTVKTVNYQKHCRTYGHTKAIQEIQQEAPN